MHLKHISSKNQQIIQNAKKIEDMQTRIRTLSLNIQDTQNLRRLNNNKRTCYKRTKEAENYNATFWERIGLTTKN